mmetsp:Transcript_4470/g.3746  ORF Transcript_4470/g.3746 Transcript_4470/m.3746 type:complete len:81 (+) Transcript_4470:535-777(+)
MKSSHKKFGDKLNEFLRLSGEYHISDCTYSSEGSEFADANDYLIFEEENSPKPVDRNSLLSTESGALCLCGFSTKTGKID